MDTRRFARFLEAFDRLTPSQTAAAIERLGTREALHLVHAGTPPVCPTCAGTRSQRWGTTRTGVQRHRCVGCRTTFTARSGTPLGRVHRPDRLLALVVDMLALRDVSCRAAARRLGVDHTTVWRWRHQVLAWMPGQAPQALEGLVEMDEAYQRESRKGSREWVKHRTDPSFAPAPPRLPWAKTKIRPSGHGWWSIPLLGLAPRGAQPDLVVLTRVRVVDVAAAVARPPDTSHATPAGSSPPATHAPMQRLFSKPS